MISFDANGVCNYCHQIDELVVQYGTGTESGADRFEKILDEIRSTSSSKRYNCVIGVSGGTDSSYMVHLAVKEWGLRPLAVHYDNTWNSAIATQNIRRVLEPLGVDLYTHVVDNHAANDLMRSMMLAGVAEIDAATDLALAETMNRAAIKFGVHHALEGHSFVTEGITPVGRNYFDGAYIQDIHKKFGEHSIATYPLMTFSRMLIGSMLARVKKIRPFWYLDYSKEAARDFLVKEYGWEYYGGHHLENRITSFSHSVYLPQRFSVDFRNNTLGAMARQGKMSREEAWREYNSPPHIETDLVSYVRKRLKFSENEYLSVLNAPTHRWWEFRTYKRRFELLRPLFKILADAELVTRSFYLKYCFPSVKE